MAEQSTRHNLGRAASTLGTLWLILYFLAQFGLFGNSEFAFQLVNAGLFIPFMVLFVGRRLKKANKSEEPDEITDSAPPTSRPPNTSSQRPPTRRPAPPPAPKQQDLATVLGFDDSDSEPEVEPGTKTPVFDIPEPSDTTSMTSEEMIAAARRDSEPDR